MAVLSYQNIDIVKHKTCMWNINRIHINGSIATARLYRPIIANNKSQRLVLLQLQRMESWIINCNQLTTTNVQTMRKAKAFVPFWYLTWHKQYVVYIGPKWSAWNRLAFKSVETYRPGAGNRVAKCSCARGLQVMELYRQKNFFEVNSSSHILGHQNLQTLYVFRESPRVTESQSWLSYQNLIRSRCSQLTRYVVYTRTRGSNSCQLTAFHYCRDLLWPFTSVYTWIMNH